MTPIEQVTTHPDAPSLSGLLLVGGKSRRMGRDKASLSTPEGPLWLRTWNLLQTVCPDAYLSIREDQELPKSEPTRHPKIVDSAPGRGPLGGILDAFARNPDHAWLVLACDLPLLDPATLQTLIGQRDPAKLATAFLSNFDGLPEPLCAIYEPAAAPLLSERLSGDHPCPRKFLIQQGERVSLHNLPHPRALENANTPEDLERIHSLTSNSPS